MLLKPARISSNLLSESKRGSPPEINTLSISGCSLMYFRAGSGFLIISLFPFIKSLFLKQNLQYPPQRLLKSTRAVSLYLCSTPGATVYLFSLEGSKLPHSSSSSSEGITILLMGSFGSDQSIRPR